MKIIEISQQNIYQKKGGGIISLTDIKIGEYYFKSYINLTPDESKLVLFHRNLNKKWMIHKDEVSLDEHLKWIESLKTNSSRLDYLVYKDDKPFIVVNYQDINEDEAYWGYILIDQAYKSEVLKIEKIIIDFAFEKLNLKRLLCINDINNHVIKIHKFFGFKELERKFINNQEYLVMCLEKEI